MKIELLCRGARTKGIYRGRRWGAGPSGGRCVMFQDGDVLNIPLRGRFVKKSPFELKGKDGRWEVYRSGKAMTSVSPIPLPRFYQKRTSDGIPMYKVAKLHGKDCLATTLLSTCWRWRQGKACKFCAIEIHGEKRPLIRKSGKQLAEAAKVAMEEGVAKHMTITTGTNPSPDRGAMMLAGVVEEIKGSVEIPIEVHLEPPEDLEVLDTLRGAGVDGVGIHLEFFDEKIRKEVCPGKAEIGREEYIKSWKEAVRTFGRLQVSSFLIVGLGESEQSVVGGIETLCKLGVVPHVVPFRPIPGTPLGDLDPPDPKRLVKIYEEMERMYKRYRISPRKVRSGCARCRACGIDALIPF